MNDQHCSEAAAWTCRQPALSQGHCSTHSADTASPCVAPVGDAHVVYQAQSFLPGLVERYLEHQTMPMTKELAVLFVDIADSANTLFHHPPVQALAVLQRFSQLVTDIALAHCGDVKDYEGDGALLYFGSLRQAARTALAIRQALVVEEQSGKIVVQARLSLNVGEVSIGVVGSAQRRTVALLGPSIHIAARLLKEAEPGGIIAPQAAIERLQREAPEVAGQFTLWGRCLVIRGFEENCITAYHIPPDPDTRERTRVMIRAVMTLSRLWQSQGKVTAARELLAEVYHRFTEGFDTKDLQEAEALLVTLGGSGKMGEEKRKAKQEDGETAKWENGEMGRGGRGRVLDLEPQTSDLGLWTLDLRRRTLCSALKASTGWCASRAPPVASKMPVASTTLPICCNILTRRSMSSPSSP